MFFIPTSVILFVFFWYLNERNKAKAKKEREEARERESAKYRCEDDQYRKERDSIPKGYALTYGLGYVKLTEEQITLLKKPYHEYTESDNYNYRQFCIRCRNYNLPL